MKADDQVFCEQLRRVKRDLILTIDSGAGVPDWLRENVCEQISAQAARIESWLAKNQLGLHAAEKGAA